jgi:hypothetical protein
MVLNPNTRKITYQKEFVILKLNVFNYMMNTANYNV